MRSLVIAGLLALVVVASASADWGGKDPAHNTPIRRVPSSCSSAPTGKVCINAVVYYLDKARSRVHLPPYALPANFPSLSPPRQLFILVNLDRIAYHLPPFPGMTSALNHDALVSGVLPADDPHPSNTSGLTMWWPGWAGGFYNAPMAYEGWMWDDGLGSNNPRCTPTDHSRCWGHRHSVLWKYGPVLAMGAAAGHDSSHHRSFAYLFVGGSSGYSPTYSYRWRQAVADGAGTNKYDPGIAPAKMCHVPVLLGLTLAAATRAIEKTHCVVGEVVRKHTMYEPGIVFRQHPAPGRTVAPGTRVKMAPQPRTAQLAPGQAEGRGLEPRLPPSFSRTAIRYTFKRVLRGKRSLVIAGVLALVGVASASAGWAGRDPAHNYPLGKLPLVCARAPAGRRCVNAGVYYLDRARAKVGLPAYKLPADFPSLTPAKQMFVLTNLDRVRYGLPPVPGLTAKLNHDALVNGIRRDTDPLPTDMSYLSASTANWAGPFQNAPMAYEAWAWDDGLGSNNRDCTSSHRSGCWGHRHAVLWKFGRAVLAMGAASGLDSNHQRGYAMLLVGGERPNPAQGIPGYTPKYSYTWSEAIADGAGTNTYNPGTPQTVVCQVPGVVGKTLRAATRAIKKAHCSVGKVLRKRTVYVPGVVVLQSPTPGTLLVKGAKIKLTLSLGPSS